jgi:hypothetical protein
MTNPNAPLAIVVRKYDLLPPQDWGPDCDDELRNMTALWKALVAKLTQAVRPVLGSIEMLSGTERDPLEQAVCEASEQKVCDPVQAFQVLVADSVPVRVDWIGVTFLAGSRPRVQGARSENPFFCSQVDEGLTNMEDALQPDAWPASMSRSTAAISAGVLIAVMR